MKNLLSFLFILGGLLHTFYAQEIEHEHSLYHGFIENKGQWDDDVLFQYKMESGNLWVEQGKLMYHLQDYSKLQKAHSDFKLSKSKNTSYRQDLIHLNFIGANTVTQIEKKGGSDHYFNFFKGQDKEQWAKNVRAFNEVHLKDLYDGIDLELIEIEGSFKYQFVVGSGISSANIKLNYANQKSLKINKNGELVIKTKLGEFREEAPFAYQILNGKIKKVDCSFKMINDSIIGFEIGDYSKRAPLVIDPVLVFATYCGSPTDNFGMTATYGYDGSAYSGGTIYGNAYPTPDPNAYNTSSNFTVQNVNNSVTTDAFISKYAADGQTMLWTSFIGGGDDTQGTETAHSLICDLQDNIYLFGVTSSTDFPIQGGFQTSHAGGTSLSITNNGCNFGTQGTDIFVAKLSANGHNLLGSTYIGGSANDGVNYLPSSGNYTLPSHYDSLTTNYGDQFRGEIFLDDNDNILIASCSRSTDFPTVTPFQSNIGGQQDGVIFKVKNDFSQLLWSSYFGGSKNDVCNGVKTDSNGDVFIAGGTSSNNLSNTAGAYNPTYGGGKSDGFLAKISSNGQNLLQATYIGENLYDQAFFVEIDDDDNVYTVGQSAGGSFFVHPSSYSNPGSSQFVAKLNNDLSALIRSTVFGSGSSSIDISPSAFLVDVCGNVYVSGWGANILQNSPIGTMATTSNAFQSSAPNGFDFYLIVFERDLEGLLYGSYLGGSQAREHVDGGTSRFDKNGVVYQSVCAGCGGVSDFPTTTDAWSSQNLASNCNNLVFKFDFELIPSAEFFVDTELGCAPFTVDFNNFSTINDDFIWDFGNGNLDSVTYEPSIDYSTPGVYDVFLYVTDTVCNITDTAMVTITVDEPVQLDMPSDVALCSPQEISLIPNSFGTASSFVWSTQADFSDTLNFDLMDSVLVVSPSSDMTYYLSVEDGVCNVVDSVQVIFTSASIAIEGDENLCLSETGNYTVSSLDPNLTISNFDWSPDASLTSPDGQPNASFVLDASQYIYVNVDVSNGCNITDSLEVNVSFIDASTVFAIASDTIVPFGSSVTLTAEPSGNYSYSWSPSNVMPNHTEQTVEAYIEEDMSYTVTVSDGICSRSDEVQVKAFTYVCGEPFVFIPNAFSPNYDGDNDVLFVRSNIVESLVFKVFDRWGELVFESNDINRGWDGTFRGKLMDPDTYDYYIEAFCIDGSQEIIKGNVTLLQ